MDELPGDEQVFNHFFFFKSQWKVQCREGKLSAMKMLANKYNQKAKLKDQELEIKKMEL